MGLSERTGPRSVRAAGRRSRPHPRRVRGRRPGRPRRARLGWADRARLGARAPGARAGDPARQHRRRAAADGSAAADPPRAAHGPCGTSSAGGRRCSSGRRSPRAHGRIGKDVRSAYLAPTRRAATGARSRTSSPTSRRPRRIRPSQPLAEVAARLPELDVPVLLAWGERDPVFHLEFAADLRRRLPQAELHRFPLAGHLVVEEEDVAALADAWIGRLLEPKRARPAAAPSRASRPRSGRRSSPARRTTRRRSPSAAAPRSRSRPSPSGWPRSPRGCGTPVSPRATASRCSRPTRRTSSPPPTRAG